MFPPLHERLFQNCICEGLGYPVSSIGFRRRVDTGGLRDAFGTGCRILFFLSQVRDFMFVYKIHYYHLHHRYHHRYQLYPNVLKTRIFIYTHTLMRLKLHCVNHSPITFHLYAGASTTPRINLAFINFPPSSFFYLYLCLCLAPIPVRSVTGVASMILSNASSSTSARSEPDSASSSSSPPPPPPPPPPPSCCPPKV